MTVKVSQKYQVVIPEEIRKQASIFPGMEVNIIAKSGVIYIIPIASLEQTAKKLAGRFSPSDIKDFREKKDRKL